MVSRYVENSRNEAFYTGKDVEFGHRIDQKLQIVDTSALCCRCIYNEELKNAISSHGKILMHSGSSGASETQPMTADSIHPEDADHTSVRAESADRGSGWKLDEAVKSRSAGGSQTVPTTVEPIRHEYADHAYFRAESADHGSIQQDSVSSKSKPIFSVLADETKPHSTETVKPHKTSKPVVCDPELSARGIYLLTYLLCFPTSSSVAHICSSFLSLPFHRSLLAYRIVTIQGPDFQKINLRKNLG